MDHTHSSLCDIAVKWLQRHDSKKGPGCLVAFSECQADWQGEIPDAIGFRCAGWEQHSVLVEVKVSRADFLADCKKPHRMNPASGMGEFRYFMAPAGLIAVSELPVGWGLIEITKRGLVVRAGHVLERPQRDKEWRRDFSAWRHERSITREMALLVRMMNRVGDAEKLQKMLKSTRNSHARIAQSEQRWRDRAEKAERELYLSKHGFEA